VRNAIAGHGLKDVIVQATVNGRPVITKALRRVDDAAAATRRRP
jgi:hypothetical protein